MPEPVKSDEFIRIVSPRVKLLPRGSLRCGPDCIAPGPPSEPSSETCSSTTPRGDIFSQLRSPRPSQHRTSGWSATFQSSVNSTGQAQGKDFESASGTKSEPVYDDEDFGDFVQA